MYPYATVAPLYTTVYLPIYYYNAQGIFGKRQRKSWFFVVYYIPRVPLYYTARSYFIYLLNLFFLQIIIIVRVYTTRFATCYRGDCQSAAAADNYYYPIVTLQRRLSRSFWCARDRSQRLVMYIICAQLIFLHTRFTYYNHFFIFLFARLLPPPMTPTHSNRIY